jgi:capsular polysaccharide transport system permease protein
LALTLAVCASRYASTDKIVAFFTRPLLFVSCVLYPLYGLPRVAQEVLLWNPLVHTIEVSRKCLFPLYHVSSVNLLYPTIFTLIVCSFGICLFHNHRHDLTER